MTAIRGAGGWAISLALVLLSACASSPDARVAGAVAPTREGLVPSISPDRAFRGEGGAVTVSALEPRVFVLANRVRAAVGKPELTIRADLIDLARMHALDMANRGYFAHRSPEGEGPGDRADRRRVAYTCLGENLARVRHSRDPAALSVTGWLKSATHRRILLDERGVGYRFTGVGAARSADGTLYIAQVFVR
jgi:uncharacterized protein YkwD